MKVLSKWYLHKTNQSSSPPGIFFMLELLFSSFTDARILALREPGQPRGPLEHNSTFLLWYLESNMPVVEFFTQVSYDI